jgi:hypothetical protein
VINAVISGLEKTIPLTRVRSLRALAGGQFEFAVTGQEGMRYEIRASSNLLDWLTLTTATNLNGTLPFSDPLAFSEAQRFYQPVLVPAVP